MAKRCVFCGKNLSFFDDKTLLCGNALQRVCTACWAELQDLDQEERAHRALDTGRAEEPEVIQAFLDRLEQTRQAQARAREALLQRRSVQEDRGAQAHLARALNRLKLSGGQGG